MAQPTDSPTTTADRVQIQLLRAAGMGRRTALARSLSASVIQLSRAAIRKRHPEYDEREVLLAFAELHYGKELAACVRRSLSSSDRMNQPDPLAALAPVADLLDILGVPYCVVGSVASSAHGVARASIDADVVADLATRHADGLVAGLANDYYVDRDAVADAIRRRSMFNVVHLETMLKVDIYVLTARQFDRESFARRSSGALDPGSQRSYSVASAEDVVLHKLEWYRLGAEVSDRQWSDIVGVLQVQAGNLDADYLSKWAARLGLADLLEKASREASSKS